MSHAALLAAAIGAVAAVIGGAGGLEVAGVRLIALNAVSASVVVAIAAIGLVVGSFTRRYAADDPRPRRLRLLILAATATSCLVAAAGSVVVLAVGWLATSGLLAALLAHRIDAPGAAAALPSALRSLVAGDLCLVAAVSIILATAGNAPLPAVPSLEDELSASSILGLDAASVVAILVVCAALGRCAQIPFGAWIAQTVAVPTPVSALLHAGIVNAGALVLISLAPVVTADGVAVGLLFGVAALSMLLATTLMVARPDVKGALALSTRGQMGFMLIACALGAFAAAIFHLVAHAMYKAALFLGAGSAIDESRRAAAAPPTRVAPARGRRALRQAVAAIALPAVVLVLAVRLLAPGTADDPGAVALLCFAWASAAQSSWWWLRLREPVGRARIAALVVLVAAVVAYVGLLAAAKELLAPDLPAPGSGVASEALMVPVVLAALGATGLRWLSAAGALSRRPAGRLNQIRRRAYAQALALGSRVWSSRATVDVPGGEPARPTTLEAAT